MTLLQGLLLPLLAGIAVKAALPSGVAAVAPLLPIAALACVSLVCGSVVAGSAEAARAAGVRLLGAVAAAQAGGHRCTAAHVLLMGTAVHLQK